MIWEGTPPPPIQVLRILGELTPATTKALMTVTHHWSIKRFDIFLKRSCRGAQQIINPTILYSSCR